MLVMAECSKVPQLEASKELSEWKMAVNATKIDDTVKTTIKRREEKGHLGSIKAAEEAMRQTATERKELAECLYSEFRFGERFSFDRETTPVLGISKSGSARTVIATYTCRYDSNGNPIEESKRTRYTVAFRLFRTQDGRNILSCKATSGVLELYENDPFKLY